MIGVQRVTGVQRLPWLSGLSAISHETLYRGQRLFTRNEVQVSRDGGKTWLPLPHRCHLTYCHSPTGFNWGYGGSGPADLAKNLLWDYFGREPEPVLYQEFKCQVVAKLGDRWELRGEEIRKAVRGIQDA